MAILLESPWWVYGLFVVLVFLGIRALLPRTIFLYRLFLIPGILTAWNIAFLAERLENYPSYWLFWVIGLVLGGYIGWQAVRSWVVVVDKDEQQITLPGTWSTLILILLIFAVRYFFIFHYEFYPEFYSHFAKADSLSSGMIVGIFIGRSLELYYKYRNG